MYVQTNLQVTEQTDRLEQILRRTDAAGYSRIFLADDKLNVLDRGTENYFSNVDGTLKTDLNADRHLHFSPAGYEVFAAKLRSTVESLLK